jgi:hypothetical protein
MPVGASSQRCIIEAVQWRGDGGPCWASSDSVSLIALKVGQDLFEWVGDWVHSTPSVVSLDVVIS